MKEPPSIFSSVFYSRLLIYQVKFGPMDRIPFCICPARLGVGACGGVLCNLRKWTNFTTGSAITARHICGALGGAVTFSTLI